jgi:hypothetical protein
MRLARLLAVASAAASQAAARSLDSSLLAQPGTRRIPCLEDTKVAAATLLDEHLSKAATEPGTTGEAHHGKPHSIVAQLLQDRARFARAQVEKGRRQVFSIKERLSDAVGQARFEQLTRIIDVRHESLGGLALDHPEPGFLNYR